MAQDEIPSGPPEHALRSQVTRAAAWSGVGQMVLRLGSLVVGIVLARLLVPEQFGVYAIALTVQTILLTVADLGLSADIIRSEHPERIAPTVATLGLVMGTVMMIATIASSEGLASLLGSPEAAPAIVVLAITIGLAGATVVPYGMLQRRFQQRELFFIFVADFTVSTTVTLVLVVLGWGVMGLAIGRLAAQVVSSTLQFVIARVKPVYGWDRRTVGPVLAFGVPIAAANMLAAALVNVDNVILARIAGATALGYYVLAFNISSWPMKVLGQMLRSISLPYFARTTAPTKGLASLTGLAWAGALPAGAMLAALSAPLIEVLYGAKWLPAAPVLAALGIYGAIQVVLDIFSGYLYAHGRSTSVLVIQILRLVALVGGLIVATMLWGIVGAGWAQVAIAVVVVLPAYAITLRHSGVRAVQLLSDTWWPTIATIPAVGAAVAAQLLIPHAIPALLVGGLAGGAVYGALMWSWLLRRVKGVRSRATEGRDPAV